MSVTPLFNAELLTRYDVRGPRYTSYPTAPNFSERVGLADYVDHARQSNDEPIPRSLSLYAHLPFCVSPCFYCGCNRVVTRDRGKGQAYLRRLMREIEWQGRLFDRDRHVRQLHLGGGTPNFFDGEQLSELIEAMGRAFTLDRGPDREFAVELDPRQTDLALLTTLRDLGFNRLSFGIQDFDPVVQEAINRVQPREQTLDTLRAARAVGFSSISLDLIYGLPRQTRAGFAATLASVLEFRPARVALYNYAHLPTLFKAQRQIVAEELPPMTERIALLGLAVDVLCGAGYRYIGMDHFALPDDELCVAQDKRTLQRNFQGYSTHADCDLIGLGVSAIGRVGDMYAQNARELGGYQTLIDAGRLPIAKGFVLGADDRLRAEIIQQWMCHGEVRMNEFERKYSLDFAGAFADELSRLEPLAADGLIEIGADVLRVTPRGRLLMRLPAMAFDAYLPRQAEAPVKFSRVV